MYDIMRTIIPLRHIGTGDSGGPPCTSLGWSFGTHHDFTSVLYQHMYPIVYKAYESMTTVANSN